ncbi:pentatricopeptide repeat-containing protein [Dorcoceras hygrometricum]|uniref:Pentatricopeptide repeat-containing protein n=1 Tax=Dorcoceras hygrometricum TaxID=472368 RepID=A0A2Z7CWL3_9LAMI|nr:pentatricopeptide repeat-containing protein [Dorcoceras hygrometricum]
MTRYDKYITRTLNAYGDPPADAPPDLDYLPETPAIAKHPTKTVPRVQRIIEIQVTTTQLAIKYLRGHNACGCMGAIRSFPHELPVAKLTSSTKLMPFSSLRGGSYPLILMATQISQRGVELTAKTTQTTVDAQLTANISGWRNHARDQKRGANLNRIPKKFSSGKAYSTHGRSSQSKRLQLNRERDSNSKINSKNRN